MRTLTISPGSPLGPGGPVMPAIPGRPWGINRINIFFNEKLIPTHHLKTTGNHLKAVKLFYNNFANYLNSTLTYV